MAVEHEAQAAAMDGLLIHANLSSVTFQSSEPPSIVSNGTLSETVQGIGTLSGRAIYAVGESALRLLISRKLRNITAVFFNDGIVATTKNMKAIYDDLLELSR